MNKKEKSAKEAATSKGTNDKNHQVHYSTESEKE